MEIQSLFVRCTTYKILTSAQASTKHGYATLLFDGKFNIGNCLQNRRHSFVLLKITNKMLNIAFDGTNKERRTILGRDC